MKLTYLSGFVSLFLAATAMAEGTPQPLFDFTGADAAKEWQSVNARYLTGIAENAGPTRSPSEGGREEKWLPSVGYAA